MILLDANLLLYAVNTDAPEHAKAKVWVEDALAGKHGQVALSWFTLVAFVRIATNPRALSRPCTSEEALQILSDWLELPTVTIVTPGAGHALHFSAACRATNATGNLVTDAHLAALAFEHDCEIASCDADFGRFPGLRWINPLVG